MTEKQKKTKKGGGKFFLGAVLGGLAGVVAGRLTSEDKPATCNKKCSCGCSKTATKKPAAKKTTTAKKTTAKKTTKK